MTRRTSTSRPDTLRLEWECPGEHLFEIGVDDNCVETFKRLTADVSGNDPAILKDAAVYPHRDGTSSTIPYGGGELLRVRCVKCGRQAIIGMRWIG